MGGKETRSGFSKAAEAVPAWLLRRPVRLILDRDEDMHWTGHRHAFLGKYKVCVLLPRLLCLGLQRRQSVALPGSSIRVVCHKEANDIQGHLDPVVSPIASATVLWKVRIVLTRH